jgi:hypothetical protein
VGEHRVDQLAARQQPQPRPLTEPVELLRPRPGAGPAHSKGIRSAPQRWRRRVSQFVRSRRGRWVLVALACLVVLVVGLLAQGFFNSPAPAVSVPNAAGGAGLGTSPPASPSPSKTSTKAGQGGNQLVSNPVARLRQLMPDNPLNHLQTGQLHQVVISASAPGRMAVVGFLVPTGMGETYGSRNGANHSFRLSQQALGGGYLAAIYLQTGKSGTPITCTITVDGKVTSSQTTSGSYGRALCLG